MSAVFKLLQKEWRDHRLLVLSSMAVMPAVSLALQWAFLNSTQDPLVGQWFIPALTAVPVFALASELVASDVQAGVGSTLERLPIRRSLHLATKALFLLVFGLLLGYWLVAFELGTRGATGQSLARLNEGLARADYGFRFVEIGAVAILAFGALFRRSSVAVLAGLACAIGIPLIVVKSFGTPAAQAFLWPFAAAPIWFWMTVASTALFLGSSLGFSLQPDRPGQRSRRVALFATGALIIVAPAIGAVIAHSPTGLLGNGWLAARWSSLPYASPSGRYVALEVIHSTPWLTATTPGFTIRRTWVIDTHTGDQHMLPPPHQLLVTGFSKCGSPWDAEERLLLYSQLGGNVKRALETRVRWDPNDHDFEPFTSAEREAFYYPAWYWWRRRGGTESHQLAWPARGLACDVPPPGRCFPSTEPGVVFYVDLEGRLIRHSMDPEKTTVLREGYEPREKVRVDVGLLGQRLAVYDSTNKATEYLDAETGTVLFGPAKGHHRRWTGLASPFAQFGSGDRPNEGVYSVQIIANDGAHDFELPYLHGGLQSFVLTLDADRILRAEHGRMEVIELSTGEHRFLGVLD